MRLDRRSLLLAGVGAAVATLARPLRAQSPRRAFPPGFLWGAATSGHQIEGNDVNSDTWLLEHVKPTLYAESSGDADDSLHRWAEDLDLVKALGLNSYRFSLEWSRIEPSPGEFSRSFLDYYARIIDDCNDRGLKAIVTFNHANCPAWFGAKGYWKNPDSPDLFARFCERAAKRLSSGMSHAATLNEPNVSAGAKYIPALKKLRPAIAAMNAAAARAMGSARFGNSLESSPDITRNLLAAHTQGFAAIKSVRPELPVGVTLGIIDDQAIGSSAIRDAKRRDMYAPWFEALKANGDFVGVQNYGRAVYDAKGLVETPPGAILVEGGAEYYPASLKNVVRYAYEQTHKPVFVTENGISTADDTLRARYIPDVLAGLKQAIDDGVPVIGYLHWSLLDNFEWIFGYGPKYGLVVVDRETFKRTPKPSAAILSAIAKANALPFKDHP
jgi:beta-glucosidase